MNGPELAAAVNRRLQERVRDAGDVPTAIATLLNELSLGDLDEWAEILNAANIPYFDGDPPARRANEAIVLAFAKGVMMGRER